MRTDLAVGAGVLPAAALLIMANAVTWWSDSKLRMNGVSRSGEGGRHDATVSDRMKPTVRRTSSFRRGAEPAKTSLTVFVLIGLVVGLFAFGMMSFCLEDPHALMAAREAKRTAPSIVSVVPLPTDTMTSPPFVPAINASPVITVSTTADTRLETKSGHARRRLGKKPSKAAPQLPTNPYGT